MGVITGGGGGLGTDRSRPALAVEVRDVSVRFGGVVAPSDRVSFEIHPG